MQERPILFSVPMVRAILDGTKTQTRRVIKPQPQVSPNGAYWHWPHLGGSAFWKANHAPKDGRWACERLFEACPYGGIGDRLWVRETFAVGRVFKGDVQEYLYRATHTAAWPNVWKPSIFMPRAASRITLEITTVRVERVQDIKDEDFVPEGFPYSPDRYEDGFAYYWEKLNAKRGHGWDANPWVWALTFKRVTP